MSFESDHQQDSYGMMRSPGGHEFGVQGWNPAPPMPKSITFFLDGSAMVSDQYGRPIRCSVVGDKMVVFADRPPDGNQDGLVVPRPGFASHAQVVAALLEEGINWLTYQVGWRLKTGGYRTKTGLTLDAAIKAQKTLMEEGNSQVTVAREVVCAGWPQLPYEELKKLPPSALPPIQASRPSHEAYLEDLSKIPNPELRTAAIKFRREMYEASCKERMTVEV